MAYLRVQLGDIRVQNTCHLTKLGPRWRSPPWDKPNMSRLLRGTAEILSLAH